MSGVVTELRVSPDEWPEVVADVDGPQLVVAGPGAGKTELLVRRAVHLLENGRSDPAGLLLLTFSRRAAGDLRRRVRERLADPVVPVETATFHSLALRLIEAFGTAGTPWEGRLPTLLTGPEQVALVAELLAAEDRSAWPLPFRDLLTTATFTADVADFLLRVSERLMTPEDLRRSGRADWAALPGFLDRYEAACRERGRIDYAALVGLAVTVAARPEVSERLRTRLRFILVDEYQDTSPAQTELLAAVAGPGGNITVTADPYESIYGFRGADLDNVVRFPHRFRDSSGRPARRIVLTTSFRVPGPVLDGALRITRSGELPGSAGPVVPADHPGAVEGYVFDQASAEAEWIAAESERLHLAEGLDYGAMAVLVRSKRRFLPELWRALDRRGIPHDTPDARLVDHPAVRVVLDTARAAAALAAGERPDMRAILLGPLYGLPLSAERDLRRRIDDPRSWPEVLAERPETAGLAALLGDPVWAVERPAADGFWHLWTTLDGIDRIVADPERAGFRRAWSALSQVLDRQAERDPALTLHDFAISAERDDFEATPLLEPTDTPDDRLTVTTFHQAKGVEVEVVFIADAVEGVFPDLRRGLSLLHPELLSFRDPAEERRFRLHEEMRLAYTAMTRARRRVVWTATAAGTGLEAERPSRFLRLAVGGDAALGPPGHRTGPPLTLRELEVDLRRTAADPAAPAADRFAALAVLAHPSVPAWDPVRFAGVGERGPDDGVILPSTRLSPSAAETYSSCPRLFALGRLGIGEEETTVATLGSLIHTVLERAERTAAAAGLPHADSSLALAELAEAWDPEPFRPHPDIHRRRAEELVRTLYTEWPDDSAGIVDLERPLTLELGGFAWRGRADRIEWTTRGTIRIVDYKTGRRMPSRKEAASSLQLGFYLLAAREDPMLGERVTEAELWFPGGERKGKRRSFDPANLPDVRARLEEIAADIRAERWDPTPGEACRWCRVRTTCPAWPVGAEAFVS